MNLPLNEILFDGTDFFQTLAVKKYLAEPLASPIFSPKKYTE